MPVPGERPICHYSGERCKYEGQACTCLLPGFTGTPPTWASDTLRAKLDKCDGLKQADKEYLLRIACAGIEYASEMQATRGVKGAAPTLPHPALDRANAGERESESRLLKQVLDALRVGRVACEWVGKPDEADKIAAAFDAARALALPAADHDRKIADDGRDAARYRWLREHAYIELDCDSPRLPGFTNDRFDALVDDRIAGIQGSADPEPHNVYDEEWVCESHPDKPFQHDGCRGAGMLSDESCARLALPAADPERREGAEGVALPDAIEKLRRCTLGCGVFGQCKATMHGKPSECAGGVPIPHTFAPPDADTDDSMEGGKK